MLCKKENTIIKWFSFCALLPKTFSGGEGSDDLEQQTLRVQADVGEGGRTDQEAPALVQPVLLGE